MKTEDDEKDSRTYTQAHNKILGDKFDKCFEEYRRIFRKNISYNDFLTARSSRDIELIDEMIDIMSGAAASCSGYMRINGALIPAESVKRKFLQINYDDIEYVLLAMSESRRKIYNMRAFLITALYNAKFTINNYYTAAIRHDMAN